MSRLILIESGSTKTSVLYETLSKSTESRTTTDFVEQTFEGFNPNRPQTSLFENLKSLNLNTADRIFFYGSGLGSEKRKKELIQTFKTTFDTTINVADDLIGGGRALLGSKEGLFAIMGTGGIAAHYDGENIVDRRGGHGYLIDDFGGGYELGKTIISSWLDGQFSENLEKEIAAQLGVSREGLIRKCYHDGWGTSAEGLRQIAGVVKVVQPYANEEKINKLLRLYFEHFFQKNVLPLSVNSGLRELSIVGSVGIYFKKQITEAGGKIEIKVNNIVQYPGFRLFEYHMRKEQERMNEISEKPLQGGFG